MKCQILLSRKNKKNNIRLLSAEFAHNMVLFVLRFYGPVNPMGSYRAWSVYLTTRLVGRLSPLSG